MFLYALKLLRLQMGSAHRNGVPTKKTKWVILRWPNEGMAQAAQMSTEAFENLYFDVCTMDYRKMAKAMVPLEKRMKQADQVHIKGPGTDLRSSIKGIGAKMCRGDRNIPDGEVFSCPVKTSINGHIQFNTPTLYSGTKFENVYLEFKDGKVIKATANNTRRLNEILDTDLKFSIKNIPAIPCFGERNIPDGELFYRPRQRQRQRRHSLQHAQKQLPKPLEVYLK